jgi:hypothetical protein
LKEYLAKKTLPLRMSIVHTTEKLFAPKYYAEIKKLETSHMETDTSPRPMIKYIRQIFQNKPLTGAEIGVYRGLNSLSILQTLNIKKLYLIDPYTFFNDGYINFGNGDINMEIAKDRTANYKDKIVWITKKSKEALALTYIPFDFDFVYIDGDHSYDAVKQDIEGYFERVTLGGIIGGHDYGDRFPGVIQASNEFANNKGCVFFVDKPDWWIVKEQ